MKAPLEFKTRPTFCPVS